MEKVNLADALARIDEHWRPRIVAEVNGQKVQVVKLQGEFVWHAHADSDDFFLVLDGRLLVDVADETVELGPGELFVVPRGVEHRPRAEQEAHVLLVERLGTVNTGDAADARGLTASEQRL